MFFHESVYKLPEILNNANHKFPEPKVTSSNCRMVNLYDMILIQNRKKQQILIFKKVEL